LIWLLACAQPGQATLVDARTQGPIAGVVVTPRREGEACPTPVPPTDADGHFQVPRGCAGHRWVLVPEDAGWWVPEPPKADEGATVSAWRVPAGGGVALLDGTVLTLLATHTAVDVAVTAEGAEVPYPVEIPDDLPRVAGSTVLVLDAEGLTVEPVLAGEARSFGAVPVQFGPWFYLGAYVRAAGPPEAVSLHPEHVTEATAGDRTVRYLPADAFPPGRYAVRNGTRAVLVDFGVTP
jgi:hypothetical protein